MDDGWNWPKTNGNCHFLAVQAVLWQRMMGEGLEKFPGKKENVLGKENFGKKEEQTSREGGENLRRDFWKSGEERWSWGVERLGGGRGCTILGKDEKLWYLI
ncbi:hypothetical protein H5410_031544 [Solanum commersonii]|uniref:Uncharacterized protein n=1 Tax=Solanum commersonii TaxID=4109 RepID=A0A9J5YMN9_SOLCO|nr:hypothetical protein H5410_031544 [Solanum commersonii]